MSGDSLIFDDEMREIVESFIVETRELLEKLDQDLVELERRPEDVDLLNRIFRHVHTIKGTSSFIGFEQMSELTHKFEDVLNKLRRGELKLRTEMMDTILLAYDLMKTLLSKLEKGDLSPIDLSEVISKLEKISRGESSKGEVEKKSERSVIVEQRKVEQPSSQQKLNVEQTIRIDVSRLDDLMNLVGELVLGRNRLSQVVSQIVEKYESENTARELLDAVTQIDFVTTELQTAVMRTRMVPIAKVFNKFPRVVRDLSRETKKEVDLFIYGEETEIDKSVVETIHDPLVHIIRNAIDHGIEPPDERERIGKPRRGKVLLKAEHEGNFIVITVEDDGRGIDPEKVKRKAIEKRLITEQEAASISDKDALNFIFLPGFSTASKVSNISGRGVGLDVVKSNIVKLNGTIDIESKLGSGTKFILKLPLTLAIIQGLLVQVSGEIFVVPLSSVVEVVRIQADEIYTVKGREVIRLRESVLPLVRLCEIFNISGNHREVDKLYVVVVGLGERRLGLVVDHLLGQKEVVIKSLGNYLSNIPGIAGATILGDGSVRMIVDVAQIFQMSTDNKSMGILV
jgi:two-component system chemotaxis sensor kinase CheA